VSEHLLELHNLEVHFPVYRGAVMRRRVGAVKAVDGVTLGLKRGEILGLVGESGCGKSTLARAIVQLVPTTGGRVLFDGRDQSALSEKALRAERLNVQMIFQDPYASLNPRMTVFDTLAEPMLVHGLAKRATVTARVSELMEQVGLAPRFMRKYPHEFSGGQRQRIAIARALALNPKLIVADEPVSALDVSVQAQILNLIAELQRKTGLTLILISHDLSVVHYLAHRIAVMYLGRIVEVGPAEAVFQDPQHPYTRALINAIPAPDPEREQTRTRIVLAGDPPSPLNPPSGCPFHPRCPYADAACAQQTPQLEACGAEREVACLKAGRLGESV
jgi:oligopeptide transport system ATP-binding protein